MNKVILMGRLTRDPDIRYSQSQDPICIARYTLAVDRRVKKDPNNPDQQTADFIWCTAFRKNAEFCEKYLHQGSKIALVGHLATGSYVNKEGRKVFTEEVIVEHQEFAESKAAEDLRRGAEPVQAHDEPRRPAEGDDDFIDIPDNIDEELPFN